MSIFYCRNDETTNSQATKNDSEKENGGLDLNSFLSMNNLMDISNRTESGKNNNKETGKLDTNVNKY